MPACSRPWNPLFVECLHISAYGDVSAPKTFAGVCRSDARVVGRSGEAPCSSTILCTASPLSNIDTRATWSNGIPWRRAYSRNASHIAWVSPHVVPVISSFRSCASSRLTRGGIGAGKFDIGTGGGDVGDAGVGAGAGTGVGDGAGAEAGGTGAGAGAATLSTRISIGT